MQRSPHLLTWDDAGAAEQVVDAAEMMRRLARVLDADYRERSFREEPRYELTRLYPAGLELRMLAGHLYDDMETLSVIVELRSLVSGSAVDRPLVSVSLSGGIERVKASKDTAWLRARSGTIVIVGASLGGIVEVQH